MPAQEFRYKGRSVSLDETDGKATVTVDGKYQFMCHLHKGNFDVWSCHAVYLCSPDLKGLAKHLVDNIDVLSSPNCAPQDGMTVVGGGGHEGHSHGAPQGGAGSRGKGR